MKRKRQEATSKKKKLMKKGAKHSPNDNQKAKFKTEKKEEDTHSDYDEADLDLSRELHQIDHYINNRKSMIDNMFGTVKEKELKAMLPPILQDTPLEEIKEMSLNVLECMSKKRIQHILAGKEMTSSSESESENSNCDYEDDPCSKKTGLHTADSTSVDTETGAVRSDQVHNITYSGYTEPSHSDFKHVLVDSLNLCPDSEEVATLFPPVKAAMESEGSKPAFQSTCESTNSAENSVCDTTEKPNPVPQLPASRSHKGPGNRSASTDMEILELELRAKAIRSLMKIHDCDS